MASTISAFGSSHIPSSPSNKSNYNIMKLESNSDDATATAKRTKVGLRPSMKESDSCSEVDLVSPPEQGIPQNEDRDVGEPSEEIKQSGRYTNGHRATAPKTSTKYHSLLNALYTPCAAEPDFGFPDENSVRVIVPRREPEMVVPRGPGRPSSTYRNSNKTVGSGPDIPQQQSSPSKKPFDFFTDRERQPSVDRGTEQAAKRRKIMPDDEDDDDSILYDRTRNATESSRSTKVVASSIHPPERKDSRQSFDVSEFRKVETIVSGTRRRRPDGRRSSTQSSREATIEEDEIQDSGPEATKLPEPYKGSANRFPARTKEVIETRNNERRRMAESKSKYFTEPYSKSNTSGLNGATRSNVDKANGSTQSGSQNGRRRISFDSISDDELSMEKPGPGLKKTDTGNIMRNFVRSPSSASISRAGDIQSSLPRANQPKTVGRPRKPTSGECPRFPVKYLRSALHLFTHLKGDDTCYLQYNPKTSWIDVMMGDSNVSGDIQYSSYTFKSTAAKKITYCLGNNKVLLSVTESNAFGSLPKLLLEVDNGATYNFVVFLQGKSGADVDEQTSDKIDRMFALTTKKFEERRLRSEAEDLRLLKQKRNRQHQADDASPTNGEKRPADFDSSMQPPRPKKLHQRLRNGSSDNESRNAEDRSIEDQRSIERELGNEPRQRQFGPKESDDDNRPTTRSTRGQHRAIRIRSPSPLRFTHENRDWQKYWMGDEPLIFPLEGTNKALVDKRDIERLDEGQYLNDNLIAFYLRFLQDRCETQRPEVFKRVLFMNTFFYPRLTSGKGRKNIDYDAVKRWTSKVNIFEYDYIVVPVNENTHWYVAIICNTPKLLLPPEERISREDKQVDEKDIVDLGEAADTPNSVTTEHKEGSVTPEMARKVSKLSIHDGDGLDQKPNGAKHIDVERLNPGTPSHISTTDEDTDRPQKVTSSAGKGRKGKRKSIPPVRKYNIEEPRIITLDSLAMTHSPTCSNLRDFLVAEAKEKLGVEITLTQPSIGMTAKNIPEQNNFCDCGLFLLGYIEGFLDHPDETIHGIMQGKTDMASSFPKMNAPEMRTDMRNLIFKLRREQIVKEHAAKAARRAAKQVGKAKEEKQTSETKIASSTSASPKPVVPPKPEIKATEESGSASETKETPKPLEEEPSPPKEPTSVSETEEVPKTPKEAVNAMVEETPNKESPSTLQEPATLNDCMDALAGFKADEAKDEKATEAPPLISSPSPSLEELPEKSDHRKTPEKVQTPPRPTRTTLNAKTGPTATKAFSKMRIEGKKPKHPSPDRNRHQKETTGTPSTPPPPQQPRQQPRSSPRNQIDIPSSSSEDSLRAGMSSSILKRKVAPRNTDEIPDSQEVEAEQGRARKVDRTKPLEDLTEITPRTRAGEAALKRERDMKQKKKSGAGALFGGSSSPRERGRRKDPVVVEDKE
ncbi:hypothetical protein V495_05907 [Pseudogymnoascus sp. VKM F-4514 (FW-929)]|nr:hypothetical protein V495_05907 [Pseudogymnoascus sp. VKM F-4514 (FW-929)]KFY55505.1 hypothetical protein V497_06924 [Pseudogymnoascus sp. VKM F-4516 (FW-969)]